MIYLMNSAVMPSGNYGLYRYAPADLTDLEFILLGLEGEFKSCLGYPQNADLIEKWIGIRPEINRGKVEYKEGDQAFIMRLKKRVVDPVSKGQPVSENPDDWEFAWVNFLG